MNILVCAVGISRPVAARCGCCLGGGPRGGGAVAMVFGGAFQGAFRPLFDPGGAVRNGLLNNLVACRALDEAGGAN